MAGWATAIKPADTHDVINHVVPRENGMRSSGQLLRAYHTPLSSSRHHVRYSHIPFSALLDILTCVIQVFCMCNSTYITSQITPWDSETEQVIIYSYSWQCYSYSCWPRKCYSDLCANMPCHNMHHWVDTNSLSTPLTLCSKSLPVSCCRTNCSCSC